MAKAEALFEEFGSGQVGAAEVTIQVDPDKVMLQAEQRERANVFVAASELGMPTKSYVDEWSEQAGYMAKNLDTARSFIKDDFCSRFPIFETIERRDLKIWVEDQLQ